MGSFLYRRHFVALAIGLCAGLAWDAYVSKVPFLFTPFPGLFYGLSLVVGAQSVSFIKGLAFTVASAAMSFAAPWGGMHLGFGDPFLAVVLAGVVAAVAYVALVKRVLLPSIASRAYVAAPFICSFANILAFISQIVPMYLAWWLSFSWALSMSKPENEPR